MPENKPPRPALVWFALGLFCAACAEKPSQQEIPQAQSTQSSPAPNPAINAGMDAGNDAESHNEKDASAIAETGPCPKGMALLPKGQFRLGEEGRRVSVEAFCMDTLEVKVADYKACVREGKCSPRCLEEKRCSAVPVDTEWGNPVEDIRASGLCNGSFEDREDHPVNCVSFDEAKAYCLAHDKRLPREEEWEWAARGGPKAMRYPWGALDAAADELCWSRPHKKRLGKRGSTCKVGSFPTDQTPQGIYDLAGNLSEWVEGTGKKQSYAALRGASFWSVDDGYVKAALWGFDSPAPRSEVFGFRCAKNAGP